jgi:predicted TIM-barrel fold metal-dependent hydrolase
MVVLCALATELSGKRSYVQEVPNYMSIAQHSTPTVIDTHRHPLTPRMVKAMADKGLFDPAKPLPQAGAGDIIFYREFVDLAYAMTKQRAAGVTLSLASNGGEVDWIGRELLGYQVPDTLAFLRDEYLALQQSFPGEFVLAANAVAIDARSRNVVEEMLDKHDAKVIAVASSYGDGENRVFLDSPDAEWLWELAEARGVVVHVHPPMNAISHEALGEYRLNEAIGRPYDSTVNLARVIASGVFDRHPKLEMMVVHMGGDIASIIGRLEFCWKLNYHGVSNPPANKMLRNQRPPSEYLRTNILVDTMGFNPAALRAAKELFGAERIMLGTDFGPVPYGLEEHISLVREVFADTEEQARVLHKNSERLLNIHIK